MSDLERSLRDLIAGVLREEVRRALSEATQPDEFLRPRMRPRSPRLRRGRSAGGSAPVDSRRNAPVVSFACSEAILLHSCVITAAEIATARLKNWPRTSSGEDAVDVAQTISDNGARGCAVGRAHRDRRKMPVWISLALTSASVAERDM
jgi:hypothetical protein